MSFLRKFRAKRKLKQVRAESDLTFQKGMDIRKDSPVEGKHVVRGRQTISLKGEITLLENKLNTPETRSTPPNHISVIRRLSRKYLQVGDKGEFEYYTKAENLFKQMNILYPLHMEKIDWISWIEASAKAKMIREARRLLQEARMLFPGDKDLDEVETNVLHIARA
ncbi:MAG: hypothetical protein ACFE9L_01170 [Candidatus Hodarchaeota archaeon]